MGVLQRQPNFPHKKRKASVWRRSEALAGPSSEAGPPISLQGAGIPEPTSQAKRQKPDAAGSPDQSSTSQVDLALEGTDSSQHFQTSQAADCNQKNLQRELRVQLQKQAEQAQRSAFINQNRIAAQKAAVRALEEKAAAASRAQAAAAQAKRDDETKRKARLDAGFAEAFRKAAEVAAAEAAQQRVVIPSANAAEVARVLAARSHLECLQLPQSPSKEALKRKYRTMAVSLHPDKCKVDHATDAFQRLVQAYQALLPTVH